MTPRPLRVGVVGCGDIAQHYGTTLAAHDAVALVGATDLEPERAETFVARFGGSAFRSLDALLADGEIDAVLNLTTFSAHVPTSSACLQAGKHVHSEKPLAMTHSEAKELVELANGAGRRLSCSPITYLGEAQQTAWKAIRDGALGPVRVVYAEVNHGRIESWHPRPQPFYEVGPLFDVGVYPLTLLTAFFGPARRVLAGGRVLMADRLSLDGGKFTVTTPEFATALVELEDGPLVRLTVNFYVGGQSRQQGIEFHGDAGSLFLGSWLEFDTPVEIAEFDGTREPLSHVREPFRGTNWGLALVELADAIEDGRPHRASGEHAAHVVEIVSAIQASISRGEPVEVTSRFPAPTPMDWAL